MPISFMGYSQDDLVKMVWLYERIEHAKNRDGFDLDKAIEKNYSENSYLEKARKKYDSSTWTGITGEKKMTRVEAERKLYPKQWGTEKRKEFLDGLEALGLIKFEEEKPKYITIEHCGGVDKNTCTVAITDAVEALRRVGILTICPK